MTVSGRANDYKDSARFRHEYKYLISAAQEAILRIKASAVLLPDSHAGEDGTYTVRSLYFDDRSDSCLEENISGTDLRSKYRIRYYNNDTGRLSLEKKSKKSGMCLKRSCAITAEECEALMNGRIPDISESMPDIKQKLFTEMLIGDFLPKTIVTYERIPLIYPGGNVRVTFDGKITSSAETAGFLSGDYPQRPVLPEGRSILEVKWDEVLPKHISRTLQLEELTWTSFSKYRICRRFHL